jgi:F-type H+-transporting ATPase subunit epsilon
MNLLKLKIVTPERLVFTDSDLESVSIPTEKGEITVLPGHIPLVSKVVHGEIVARKKGKEESLVTTNGFLKLTSGGEVLILSDYAVRSDEVEIAKVEEAKKKAEAAMREKKSEKEFVIAEAELRKTLLELRVATKRKIRIRET